MAKGRINNVIRIPTALKGKFFRYWIECLAPFHNLTDREMDVFASFLKLRNELSKSVNDNAILDELLMSSSSKRTVREECNMSSAFFQAVMAKLKKSGMITGNRINPKFIPKGINEDDKSFQLLFYFDLDGGDNS